MKSKENLSIKILYFHNSKVIINKIEVIKGIKIIDIIDLFPNDVVAKFKKKKLNFGVFGKLVDNNYKIKNGDRVELYETALIDPKDFRILKAKKSS
tara:strand:- start:1430 stop:1717 length:288 start_codon:yes stop_codon:yes gene_type:complete